MSDKKSGAFKAAISGVGARLKAKLRADSWENAMTGLGGRKDKATYMAFRGLRCMSPEEAECLYHGDDLAARIVDALVDHAFMQGFGFEEDPDGQLEDAMRRWDVLQKVTETAIWGRTLGGAALLLGVNRGRMDEPLDLEQVRPGDLKYLMVLDRRSLHVESYFNDPEDPEFGQPETFRIYHNDTVATAGTFQGSVVHSSRMIMFGGALTSDRMKRRNSGWDMSVLQRPYDVLRDTNNNWRAVTHLMQDLSQAVYKVKGLVDLVAEGQGSILQDRIEILNMARSVARSVLVDAEHEDFTQVGAQNIAGVEAILERTWQRLAAAARMPVTILMGMSPSGMNATGDADMRSWFNDVRSYQEMTLAPKLELLARVIAASEGIRLAEQPKVMWPSLWQMSPTEQAAFRAQVATTDVAYINSGVLLPEEVTLARWGRGAYSHETSHAVDLEERERSLAEPESADPEPPALDALRALTESAQTDEEE